MRGQTRDLKMANIAETSGAHKVDRTNCLFASKDLVQTVLNQPCVVFMAFSCPSVVLGHLKKKKKKQKDGENHGLANFPCTRLAMYFS